MIVGFTGTRKGMTEAQCNTVRDWLYKLATPGSWLHHGCATGADTTAHAMALDCGMCVHGWPGPNPNTELGRFAAISARMPPLVRNLKIVEACDLLIAAPFEEVEQRRGGTWSTIRAARRRNMPVVIVLPDGSAQKEQA